MLIITWGNILHKAIIKIGIVFVISFASKAAFATEIPQLISTVETAYNIPKGLLAAIAKVESGNKPYALNIAGKSVIADSKDQAEKVIKTYLEKGNTNIDIGLMQINWRWHNDKFADVNSMLDPRYNAEYAAKLLISLYEKYGTWQKAVRYYHSAKGEHHRKYSKKVLLSWLGS